MRLQSAKPMGFDLPQGRTALIMIDMQRDFIEQGGYGYLQCNSETVFSQVSNIIKPCVEVLEAARRLGITIIHTREGHESDLRDLPPSKKYRQYNANPSNFPLLIGDVGPMGKLLVRGQYGHDIIDSLKPLSDEVVIDKPGKGTFFNTDIHQILVTRGITHLLLCGVTTECCVATTFREANDHGFECCTLVDCTNGFNANIVKESINMFCAYDGLLGYVGVGDELVKLAKYSDLQLNVGKPVFWNSTFLIDHSIDRQSNLVKSVISKGGKLTDDDPTFKLGVDNGNVDSQHIVFTPSSGMISLHKTNHTLYSSIYIEAKTLRDIRKVFVNERWFDKDDELSKNYYEFPIKHTDYRGIQDIHFSSKLDIDVGTKVSFNWDLFESVSEHKDLMEYECSLIGASGYTKIPEVKSRSIDLLKKRRQIINLFQPFDSPKVLIVNHSQENSMICRLLGFPSISINGLTLIGEFGLDGLLLDIATFIDSKVDSN